MLVDFNLKENDNLKKGCLFIYDGKQAIPISKEEFLKDVTKSIKNLQTVNEQQDNVIKQQNEKIAHLEKLFSEILRGSFTR